MSAFSPGESHEDIGVLAATRRRTIRELARTDPYVNAAIQLVDHNGYSWPVAMDNLVVALVQDRARMIEELVGHIRRCTCRRTVPTETPDVPILQRLATRVDDVLTVGAAELQALVGGAGSAVVVRGDDDDCIVCGNVDCVGHAR